MREFLLNTFYKGEAFFSHLQGIAFNNPVLNGEYLLIHRLKQQLKMAVDAGANIGDWTQKLYSKANGECRIICLEPQVYNAQHLKTRFKNINQVSVLELALSSADGTAHFSGSEQTGAGNGFLTEQPNETTISVETIKLDTLWKNYGKVPLDLVKCDIEGNEMAALDGAEACFKAEAIGTIQLEYNNTWLRAGKTMKDLFDFVSDYQYKIFVASPLGFYSIPFYLEGLEDFRLRNLIISRSDHQKLINPLAPIGRARVETFAPNSKILKR